MGDMMKKALIFILILAVIVTLLVIKDGGCEGGCSNVGWFTSVESCNNNMAESYVPGGEGRGLFSCAGKPKETAEPGESINEFADRPGLSAWDGTYYSELTAFEKKAYDSMYRAAKDGEQTCKLPLSKNIFSGEAVERAFTAFLLDHPELIGYDTGYTIYSDGWLKFEIYDFWKSKDRPDYTALLTERVREIAKLAEEKENDFEKAVFVYEYVGRNARYDEERLLRLADGTASPEDELIYTAYGCLVEGGCVCSGYSAALKLVYDELGIPCCQVSGESMGESHAWNIIKLGDNWYHIDLTWDDGVFVDDNGEEYPGVVAFEYFGLSDEEIYRDHSVDGGLLEVPECASDEYDYYRYYGLILEEYSEEAARASVERQIGMGRSPIVIKYANREAFIKGSSFRAIAKLEDLIGEDYVYSLDHDGWSVLIVTGVEDDGNDSDQ
jgi:hypothetical protein